MTRNSKSLFGSSIAALILTSGLAMAQDQPPVPAQPPANGGWRRATDAPPATTPQIDPTEPVDRSDAYGQAPQDLPQQRPQPQYLPPQSQPQASNRPAYGVPPQLTLKPGTFFTVRTNEMLASDKNRIGDVFTATLVQPLVSNGVVVAQRGQTVAGTVADVGKDKDGKRFIRLQLNSITTADGSQVPVQSHLSFMQGRTTPGGVEAGTVIGTTAVGAAIGGAAAWGTGAAIGAGVGAIAGLAAVIATHNHPAVVYPETALTFQTTAPITVSTTNAPQAFRYAGPEDFQQQAAPVMRGAAPRPYPGPGAAYAPGYVYPPAYFYGRGYYPGYYSGYYPYYGPGFGVVVGRGWGRRW